MSRTLRKIADDVLALPEQHQSPRIRLIRATPDDAALLFHEAYSRRDFMRSMAAGHAPDSEAEVRRRLQIQWERPVTETGEVVLLVKHVEDGVIGMAVLTGYDPDHRHVECLLGLFDQAHRHAGLGFETMLLVYDLVFNRFSLNKLHCGVYGFNRAARSFVETIGFVLEGVLREEVLTDDGGKADLRLYALTADDFRSNRHLADHSSRLLGRDITRGGGSI